MSVKPPMNDRKITGQSGSLPLPTKNPDDVLISNEMHPLS